MSATPPDGDLARTDDPRLEDEPTGTRARPAAPAGETMTFPQVARLELDQLLQQLVERAQDVMVTQGRLRGLLAATQAISADLDLPVLLHRITQAACDLVGARYGALGVIGAGGELTEFVTVGIDESAAARIGALPHGGGLLGALIRTPEPLRLADLGRHQDSVGFPPGHPSMHSFLGVPVRVRDHVYGNLYLTEKTGTPPQFGVDDQELLVALASAAGVAIDNARLLDVARRRQRWLQASADVVRDLLADEVPVLAVVAQHARRAAAADLGVVLLADGRDDESLIVAAADGEGARALHGTRVPRAHSLAGKALAQERNLVFDDAAGTGEAHAAPGAPMGPALIVRIPSAASARPGVVSLTRHPGAPTFDEEDQRLAADFASHAGLAMDQGRAQDLRRRLSLLDDRDRIARDLHDHVIQRLFGVGLRMSALAARTSDTEVAAALRDLIDDGDETIRTIRSTIFALRDTADGDLQSEVQAVVDEFDGLLGFAPRVVFDGPLNIPIDAVVIENARAVVREALSNCARHARASSVLVRVEVSGPALSITVEDDGVGMPPKGRRSGLENLAARAEGLGGELVLVSPVTPGGGGTCLQWRVRRSSR